MFWDKKKRQQPAPAPGEHHGRDPLLNPITGKPLEPELTPGYYPNFHTLDQQNYWDAATRTVVLDRVNNIPPIHFFNPQEVLTMQAVIDRILPQEDRTDENRIPILPFLDKRLHMNRIEGYRYEDMPSDQETCSCGTMCAESSNHTNFFSGALRRRNHSSASVCEVA